MVLQLAPINLVRPRAPRGHPICLPASPKFPILYLWTLQNVLSSVIPLLYNTFGWTLPFIRIYCGDTLLVPNVRKTLTARVVTVAPSLVIDPLTYVPGPNRRLGLVYELSQRKLITILRFRLPVCWVPPIMLRPSPYSLPGPIYMCRWTVPTFSLPTSRK